MLKVLLCQILPRVHSRMIQALYVAVVECLQSVDSVIPTVLVAGFINLYGGHSWMDQEMPNIAISSFTFVH